MARFQPGHYLGYQAIADGSLGKLVTGEFTYKCFRPQEYYTGTRGTWAVDGGGVMLLQAIHSLDVMLWYMGDVESVFARWGTLTHQMESEDTAFSVVTFTSGAMATLVGTTTFHNDRPGGMYGGGSMTRIEVGGDKGSLILQDGKVAMWKSLEADAPPSAEPPVLNTFQDVARWVKRRRLRLADAGQGGRLAQGDRADPGDLRVGADGEADHARALIGRQPSRASPDTGEERSRGYNRGGGGVIDAAR